MPNGNDQPQSKAAETVSAIKAYFNPIVAIAFAMLMAIVTADWRNHAGPGQRPVLAHMGRWILPGG